MKLKKRTLVRQLRAVDFQIQTAGGEFRAAVEDAVRTGAAAPSSSDALPGES